MVEVPPPLRLALLEDHALVRDGLLALLAGAGHDPLEVVYAGVDPLAAAAARPDVVLLDVDLGSEGPGVVTAVRVLTEAGAHVLLVSALAEPAEVRAAIAAGALGYVPKRSSAETLWEALATVQTGEMHLTAELASILAAGGDRPDLSPRELDALRLYASGIKLATVARRMGVSPYTAKEYLDRVRSKYAAAGRSARTRSELYEQARRDGFLPRRDDS